jgi:hypothetical protein
LNQCATGISPKKERSHSVVHFSVSRFLASTVWPEAASQTFCLALPPQPGFS